MGYIVAAALLLVLAFGVLIAVTAWSVLAGSHGPVHRQTKVDREFNKIVQQLQ